MSEPYDTIDKLTAGFNLVETPASKDGKILAGFEGFVVPSDYINSYNRVALAVRALITLAPNGLYNLCAGFSSFDDSGMTVHSPHESKEKALNRLKAFRAKVEEWHPFMPPSFDEWSEWAKQNGVTVDCW